MKRTLVFSALILLCAMMLAPSSMAAQDKYNFTAALSLGAGGPLDADEPDPGLGNTSIQGTLSWITQPKTRVGVRVGQIDLSDEALGSIFAPDLRYATVSGEYRFQESTYQSGIFLGLGVYSLDGTNDDDTALGLTLGFTGDFPVSDRWSVLAELVGTTQISRVRSSLALSTWVLRFTSELALTVWQSAS